MEKAKLGVFLASGLLVSALVAFGAVGASHAHEGSDSRSGEHNRHSIDERPARLGGELSERARSPRRGENQRPPRLQSRSERKDFMGAGTARGPLGAVADALGVDVDELRRETSEGKTIREFAEERGIDVDNAIDVIVEKRRERITEVFNSTSVGSQRHR